MFGIFKRKKYVSFWSKPNSDGVVVQLTVPLSEIYLIQNVEKKYDDPDDSDSDFITETTYWVNFIGRHLPTGIRESTYNYLKKMLENR